MHDLLKLLFQTHWLKNETEIPFIITSSKNSFQGQGYNSSEKKEVVKPLYIVKITMKDEAAFSPR